MSIMKELPKIFDFKKKEQEIFSLWEDADVFSGKVDKDKEPFCVVIPPPNVTGILHMGHVLDNVPQDIMTRWHRMRGFAAVWIPGTDHAGIATQNVVKRKLDKEGIDYRTLGREKFVEEVWKWKEQSGSIIINQLKRLGCSCDYERERFTMDEGLSNAVRHAFVNYFKKGLIYKGKRMINWCTVCETALANDEVEHEAKSGSIWSLKYPILDDNDNETGQFAVVATTRPETMLGDTAVAVNPNDDRYKDLVGKNIKLPLTDRVIKIIADDYVDAEFGSGMVKITPAHDVNDYEMGKRHNLEEITVIDESGKITLSGSKYDGLDRYEARKQVVADLENHGLLEGIEKHKNAVGTCYRCNSVVEPLISDQWFVKMKPLAEKAKAVVENGSLEIIPESEKNDYFSWMNSIQDWCISRQLWWGHRIPVFYCDECGHENCDFEDPSVCEKCGSDSLKQEEDVLDTWFSSQLWPFSTLGYPDKTEELDFWYPNTWLMSGRDILFFWDARMIMSGLELMGDIPFKTLALHGLVRDKQGRKLSKSLGNSPDPIGLFDEYGTDAIRAAIMSNYPMGRQDSRLSDNLFKESQGLIIKIWNATRLLLTTLGDSHLTLEDLSKDKLNFEDKWIISRLNKTIEEHDKYLNKSDFVHAFQSVNKFFWNDFCDWYLEAIKPRLWSDKNDVKLNALNNSFSVLLNIYKLFHPYIPFVTETLYQTFVEKSLLGEKACSAIAISDWPKVNEDNTNKDVEDSFDILVTITKAVRDLRANLLISPKLELSLNCFFEDKGAKDIFEISLSKICKDMNFITEIAYQDSFQRRKGFVPLKFSKGIVQVSLPDGVDVNKVINIIEGKIDKLDKSLKGISARLQNKSFVEKAEASLVKETKDKALELESALEKLNDVLSALRE